MSKKGKGRKKETRNLAAVRGGDPFEALFVVAALGGQRPAELLALRWEDFDEKAGTLRIDESVSHRGGCELDWNAPKTEMGLRRVLPLAGEARMLLAEHRRAALETWMASNMHRGGKAGFGRALIFPRPDDPERPYGRHALPWPWQSLRDRAGLKRDHLYALGHTASMLLRRSGSDPKITQGIMGHSGPRTTLKIYTHFEEGRAREAVSRLETASWATFRGQNDVTRVIKGARGEENSRQICGIGIRAAGLR